MIKRVGGKYWLQTKDGRHLGGPWDTKAEVDAHIEKLKKYIAAQKDAAKLKAKHKKWFFPVQAIIGEMELGRLGQVFREIDDTLGGPGFTLE